MQTKVFGIGLHKTGTSTLGNCLHILGYHVCPEETAYATLDDVAAHDYGSCLEVAENYDGFEDSPWNCGGVYKVLDAAFPQSKFILTTRDEERWFQSFLRWVTLQATSEAPAVLCTLGGPLTAGTKQESIEAYRHHNAEVIDYFSDRPDLLVVDWETGDGWQQLCEFLDKPIPDATFPHLRKHTPAMRCSIVMATRNKAAVLADTLESIAVQKVPFPCEVIVVDDGSTDNTPEVCRRYGVQYHRLENPRYRNPSKARNVGYRAARGDVILAQSDDVIHVSPHAIEFLTCNLRPGEFLLAQTDNYRYQDGKPVKFIRQYCGPACQVPYFFLGAVWRTDLYAVGGCDEEFVEPCYDDNWFADCLMKGLWLKVRYTSQVKAHHQDHHYEINSHAREEVSRKLYAAKLERAKRTGIYCSSGGPWPEKSRLTPEGKIPKCMSFFWAGQRISWMRQMTLRSFRFHNPDWRIVLHRMDVAEKQTWESHELQDSQAGPDYTEQLNDLGIEVRSWKAPMPGLAPAHVSDLCQWAQVYDGGFFADMDILFVRPMPYHVVRDADAVFCLSDGFMAIGLLGASPACRLFRDIADEALAGYSAASYQSTGAEAVYRLAKVEKWAKTESPGAQCLARFRARYSDLSIREIPWHVIYPYNHRQTARIFRRTDSLPPQCVGIHWFGGNRLSQEWNDRLTHENFSEYQNTYTAYVLEMV